MKAFFLIGLLAYSLHATAQKLEAKKVTGPELYKLNSTIRSKYSNGQSRLYIALPIPGNAEYCYVTISTASSNGSQQIAAGIDLLGQISSKIPSINAQGIAIIADLSAQILNVNKGSVADIYLIPSREDAFVFNEGIRSFRVIQDPKKNYNGGTICLPVASFRNNTIFVGVVNNSSTDAVWVNIEAVALVKPPEVFSPEKQKAESYVNLGWEAFKEGDIDKCIEFSRNAIKYDSACFVAMFNLGLCYLSKNDEQNAVAFYVDALSFLKQKEAGLVLFYLKEALKDIEVAESNYPDIPSGYIARLLRSEYNNTRNPE